MKAKIMKSLLTIACLLGSISVSAYDFTVDGMYYNIVSLEDLTCSVTSGDEEYSGNVVISEKVTYNNRTLAVVGISGWAFSYDKGLISVTIPNSVTWINDNAFNYCDSLEKVIIEDGTETLTLGRSNIGSLSKSLFFYCKKLKSLYLGRNLSYTIAFREVQSLVEVTICNSVTEIGDYAFWGCSGLESVTIPNSVTSIGYEAFYECFKLEKVIIEDGTETLRCGGHSFDKCRVKSLYLGRDLSYDRAPFNSKSSLTEVIIGDSVTSIGEAAFSGCSGLASMTIPNSVTSIGEEAFYGCSGLTNMTIPNSVTSIGEEAFYGCFGLTNITIPNSVTSIGNYTFYGCSGLTSITIPNSVTKIGNGAFSDCSGLTSLYSLNPTPPTIGTGSFTTAQLLDLNVYVPQGSLSAYQSVDVWKDFWNLQEFDPSGIETVKTDGKKANGLYYDILGHKLDGPKNGLNIINGKKVMIKR